MFLHIAETYYVTRRDVMPLTLTSNVVSAALS